MHEKHEEPKMTLAATWSSQEFSLAPAPAYGLPFSSAEAAPEVDEIAVMAPVTAAPSEVSPVDEAPAELVAAHARIADQQV